jgi:hypothetical protein
MMIRQAQDAGDLACRRCNEDAPEGGYLVEGLCRWCQDTLGEMDDAVLNPPVVEYVPRYDFTAERFDYRWWATL